MSEEGEESMKKRKFYVTRATEKKGWFWKNEYNFRRMGFGWLENRSVVSYGLDRVYCFLKN